MDQNFSFTSLVQRHFSFLIGMGFNYIEITEEFNISDVVEITNGNLEFIIGLDPRDKVVDIYLRKSGSLSTSSNYSLYQYLVEKHGYRGGFPQVNCGNLIETQIAKQALLLKANIEMILKNPKLA